VSAATIHQEKRRRHVFSPLLALLLLAFARRVSATELAGAVIETASSPGAEDCPQADALKARTLAYGRPRARPSEPRLVRVDFRREADGFAATVRTGGPRQLVRELAAPGATCDQLATATSVVLAVLLDLLPPDASEHSPPLPAAARQPRSNAPPVFRHLSVGPRFGAQYGLLGPALGASFGAVLALRLSRAEIEAAGFVLPERSVSLPPGTVSAQLTAGSAGVCVFPWLLARSFELGGCASLMIGRLAASGRGFYRYRDVAEPWLGGRLGATFVVPLGRHVALRAGLDWIVPLIQPSLVVERVGTAYEASLLTGAFSFGPELRFP
jgi:hypothetical protein